MPYYAEAVSTPDFDGSAVFSALVASYPGILRGRARTPGYEAMLSASRNRSFRAGSVRSEVIVHPLGLDVDKRLY